MQPSIALEKRIPYLHFEKWDPYANLKKQTIALNAYERWYVYIYDDPVLNLYANYQQP